MKRFLPLISIFVLFILMLSGFAHAHTKDQTVLKGTTVTYSISTNTTGTAR